MNSSWVLRTYVLYKIPFFKKIYYLLHNIMFIYTKLFSISYHFIIFLFFCKITVADVAKKAGQ